MEATPAASAPPCVRRLTIHFLVTTDPNLRKPAREMDVDELTRIVRSNGMQRALSQVSPQDAAYLCLIFGVFHPSSMLPLGGRFFCDEVTRDRLIEKNWVAFHHYFLRADMLVQQEMREVFADMGVPIEKLPSMIEVHPAAGRLARVFVALGEHADGTFGLRAAHHYDINDGCDRDRMRQGSYMMALVMCQRGILEPENAPELRQVVARNIRDPTDRDAVLAALE